MEGFSKIISINGVPRSGTTWVGQIIDSSPSVRYKYQPIFSNSFKDRIHVRSKKEEIKAFFQELYHYEDDFLDRKFEKERGIHQDFPIKEQTPSNLAFKHVRYHYLLPQLLKLFDNLKVVGIIRNPCGVLNSWRNNKKEFFSSLNFREEWQFAQNRDEFKPEEYFGFHKWKEFSKIMLFLVEKYPSQAIIMQYEDIVKNPLKETENLFEFLNLKITEQTKEFINQSISYFSKDPYSIYKSNKRTDDWKEQMEEDIVQQIYSELEHTQLSQFLKA